MSLRDKPQTTDDVPKLTREGSEELSSVGGNEPSKVAGPSALRPRQLGS